MDIPRFENKWRLQTSYSPALFLDQLRAVGWEPGVVPESVVLTYARFESYLATDTDAYTPNHMLGTGPGRFFLVNATDQRVAVNCLGTGASATAAQMELQAELGVRRFVVLGTAGGLVPSMSPGDIVVPTSAVRDEGTSDHYADPETPAVADSALADGYASHLAASGFDITRGPTWTTAAPFRTTSEEVAHYAAHGVITVEEEVAALFVVGASRGVRTAAALVVDGVADAAGGWSIDLRRAGGVLRALLAPTIDFLAG